MRDLLKWIAFFGAISLVSYTGGQASAPYLAEEYVELKNELWRYKQALAGVIRKVLELDREVKNLKKEVSEVKNNLAVAGEGTECFITASWLRIRKCPSLKCEVIGLLKKGTRIAYIDEIKTDIAWKKTVQPKEGYIASKYCR